MERQQGLDTAPKRKTTAVHSTETVKEVRQFVRKIYAAGREAKERGQKVAWVMNGFASAVIKAFDIVQVFPENYAAFCAAKRAEIPFLEKAESVGYSNVICSLCRTCLGFASMRQELGMIPPEAPDGGMVDPDMLLGCSLLCEPRYKTLQAVERYLDIPHYEFDVAFVPLEADRERKEYTIKYNIEELKGLIAFLEKQTDKKIDWDKVLQLNRIQNEQMKLWQEVYQLRKAVPCPMPSEDNLQAFVPDYYFVGEPESLDFFRRLRDEVKDRVERKIGVIPDEKYRLLWTGGPPPWHSMDIFNYFESLGAVCVIETPYYGGEIVPFSLADFYEEYPSDPLRHIVFLYESRTRSYAESERRVLLNQDLIRDYQIDGVVMHLTRSCRAIPMGMVWECKVLQEQTKTPVLFLESDIADSREYFETQIKAQIDAFIDILEHQKRK